MADKRTILSDYFELIDKYKGLAEAAQKELEECRKEMRQMKADIVNRINDGQYLWDSKRIVISAPEIIIGNVTKNGELKDGGKVIIMGNSVNVNGVGPAGSVTTKAPSISQVAVNPGNDGLAEIVEPTSHILSLARGIQLHTQSPQTAEGYGATFLPTGAYKGVNVFSDSEVNISAKLSHQRKKNAVEGYKQQLENSKQTIQDAITPYIAGMTVIKSSIEADAAKSDDLANQDDLTKTNILALDELNDKASVGVPIFLRQAYGAMYCISQLAENNRKITCLNKELEEINKVDDEKFKKDSTKTRFSIESEQISILSMDGEGNIRTNPEANILIRGNKIGLSSQTMEGKLTPEEAKGSVNINSRNINMITAELDSPTYENNELKTAKFPVVGTVNINSKLVNVNAMDLEQTDKGKFKETKLTEDGEVNIRAMKVKVKTINEQGKSVGKFSVNSQKISMKSTDIKEYKPEIELDNQGNAKPKEMHSDKVAADSQMLLLSDTINIGFKKEKMTTNRLDLFSKNDCNLLSETKIALAINKEADDAAEAGITVSDNMTKVFNRKKTRIMGKGGITVNGETTFESKVTGKTIEVENLNASKAVKSPNFVDGVLVDSSKPGEDPNEKVKKNESGI
jgi:hypothetical protein